MAQSIGKDLQNYLSKQLEAQQKNSVLIEYYGIIKT